ncbi:MAG: hypothetical protein ABFE01_01515, partial [Phycisphaerales bacterium]
MRNGVHTTSTRARVGCCPVIGRLLVLGLLATAITFGTAFAQAPQPEATPNPPQPQTQPQPQPQTETPQTQQWQNEGCRDMMVQMLEQLRQKAIQVEDSIEQQTGEPDQRVQVRRGELRALRQEIRSVERA